MKKILNAFFLTIITLVTFSCSDVPAPYDVNEGGSGEGPALAGDGTKENPYDVASAMKKQDSSEAWVMGYIVGCINKSIQEDAVFAPPFTNPANILIAATATETDYKKCIPVQLVSATDVRAALNLVDNGANLGKAVVIKGQLIKYFGVAGLKSPTAAVLDGKDVGGGTDPEPGDKDNPLGLNASNPVANFEATFDNVVNNTDYELASWINKPLSGSQRWQGGIFNDVDKYIKATTYGLAAAATAEYWWVTPAFTVDAAKKLTFDCAGANFRSDVTLKLFFLQLEAGKMTQKEIAVSQIPTSGTNFAWVTDITVDLSSYAGKVGFIGFQYVALGDGAVKNLPTYQLDNIKYGEGGVDPDPDPDPSANLVINNGFEDWTAELPTGWDNKTFNSGITKSTDIKHGGNNAIKHTSTSSTIKLQQEVEVVGGKTYRISYWYLDNDANAKCRMWSAWVAGTAALDDNKEELQDAKNEKYSVDNPEWKQATLTLTAPATATKFRFEVRTNKEVTFGGSVYFDDFEVSEIK